MTKTTTAADLRATCVAWATAALLHIGVFFLLWHMDRPTGAALRQPQESPVHRLAQQVDRRQQAKQQQRTRVLPAEHARLLMEQSELLVRRELRWRLNRFDEIADTVLRREEGLLDRIENRPTATEFSTEVNNTAKARTNNSPAPIRLPPDASIRSTETACFNPQLGHIPSPWFYPDCNAHTICDFTNNLGIKDVFVFFGNLYLQLRKGLLCSQVNAVQVLTRYSVKCAS